MKSDTKIAIRSAIAISDCAVKPSAKSTQPPWAAPTWQGRQRKKPAENKAERIERVAAEMRERRTKAQRGATQRREKERLSHEELQMTLSAIKNLDRAGKRVTGSQGTDIWPLRPAIGRYEESW